MALAPAPSTLGLHSPALGYWFHTEDTSGSAPTLPTLPAPNADLSVTITLADDVDWHAPTHGTRSFFVADAVRPAGLARYRNAAGAPAFTTGNVVVLFELWPDAEVRLDALTATLPRPDGSTGTGVPTRPRVHALALEFAAADIGALEALTDDWPANVTTDTEKLDYLGLASTGAALTSGAHPNAELRMVNTDSSVLVQNRSGSSLAASLWAFDALGRPIDPGAVASWWNRLATTDWSNLWASTTAADNRTVATGDVTAALTAHLVDAHEGPLSAAHLARLTPTGLSAVGTATEVFAVNASSGGTAVTPSFALATAPSPDDAPIPRLALLPYGSYGTVGTPDNAGTTVLTSWASSATFALTRDFVRLAFVDVESHLVGLDRTDPTQADADLRITADINTASTPFLANTDAAANELLNVLTGGEATLMSAVLDETWGAALADPLEDGAISPIRCTVAALAGEGRDDASESVDQLIVAKFDQQLPPGSWIRVWPSGFDTRTGKRFRTNGGGARADSNGTAYVILPIANGASGKRMGFDALVVSGDNRRFFGDERFDRPDLVAGSRATLPASPDGIDDATLWICEQGVELDRADGNLRSGDHVLVIPDDPSTEDYALVDLSSVETSDFVDRTLGKDVDAADTLIVTDPAFGPTEPGTISAAGSGPDGSTVVLKRRANIPVDLDDLDEFGDWVGMGNPIPSMEKREVAAVDDAADLAAIGTTPGRASDHEQPFSVDGHPGVAASDDIHGTGVALAGPAAHPLVALLRERRADDLVSFIQDATTLASVPTVPTGGGAQTWATTLETTAVGAAGDQMVRQFLQLLPNFLPGDTWESIRTGIEGAVRSLPGMGGFNLLPTLGSSLSTAQATQLARALDQVILKTKHGRRQAATSMLSAIGRAQDFVYIETPAIDALSFTPSENDPAINQNLVTALTDRVTANPSLSVVLCVPQEYLDGQPSKLEELRRSGVGDVIKSLVDLAPERVAWFAPVAGPGRPLHMSSTTMIVDDALLISGTTHLWRRGLTFDSSLAAALFDDNLIGGRPALVRTARRLLLAERLGLATNLISDDPTDFVHAARLLTARGGLGRVDTEAYAVTARPATPVDDAMWLPDGSQSLDWFVTLAALLGQTDEDADDFVR